MWKLRKTTQFAAFRYPRLARRRPGEDSYMRRGILGVACLLVLVMAFAGSAQAARYDAHTVIVKFASGVSDTQRATLLSSAGVTGTTGHVAGVGADVVTVTSDPATLAAPANRRALGAYAGPHRILKAPAPPDE